MVAVAVLVARVAVHPAEVRVDDGLFGRDAPSGVVYKERVEQVKTNLVEIGDNVCNVRLAPLRERWLEVWEGRDTRPVLLVGCAEDTGAC